MWMGFQEYMFVIFFQDQVRTFNEIQKRFKFPFTSFTLMGWLDSFKQKCLPYGRSSQVELIEGFREQLFIAFLLMEWLDRFKQIYLFSGAKFKCILCWIFHVFCELKYWVFESKRTESWMCSNVLWMKDWIFLPSTRKTTTVYSISFNGMTG